MVNSKNPADNQNDDQGDSANRGEIIAEPSSNNLTRDDLTSRQRDEKAKVETREEKLARQLRENLQQRKIQSRARNTKPRKFKNKTT